MIKNILVALDGSSHSEVATRVALALTARLEARLQGLHVVDLWLLRGSFLHDVNGMLGIEPQVHMAETVETFLEARATSIVDAFRLACEKKGVTGHGRSITGLVSDELVAAAAQADLLVLGARGVSLDRGQSLAGRHLPSLILGDVTVPMWITNADMSPIHKAVVAFDGSPGAFKALGVAAELASRAQVDLSVMWVDSGGLEYAGRDALGMARNYLEPWGLDVEMHSREGVPRKEIPRWMKEIGADLLVTGSHGPSRLREVLLGHLPSQLLEEGLGFHMLVCP